MLARIFKIIVIIIIILNCDCLILQLLRFKWRDRILNKKTVARSKPLFN